MTEYMEVSELVENPENPRKITRTELEKLKKSIQELGFSSPITINTNPERQNMIIGGHQRIKAAKELGITKIPVFKVNLSKDKENILNIALNRISGQWDDESLIKILEDLNKKELMELSGFDQIDLEMLLKNEKRLVSFLAKEKDLDENTLILKNKCPNCDYQW